MANSELKDYLNKLREKRLAKQKARIEKLRELNLKKYNTTVTQNTIKKSVSSVSVTTNTSIKHDTKASSVNNTRNDLKNQYNNNISTKTTSKEVKDGEAPIKSDTPKSIPVAKPKLPTKEKKQKHPDISKKETTTTNNNKTNKDIIVSTKNMAVCNSKQKPPSRPPRLQLPKPKTVVQNPRQSVLERLYKPKVVHKEVVNNTAKNPKKVIRDTNTARQPVRRSISAVHLKKISNDDYINKWTSVGENLNKVNLSDINEDYNIKGEILVSAVKTELKFQTPVPFNFNTPKPEELQTRLQNWLQKRGKTLDSFHHLQCFGIHHLTKEIKPLNINATKPPKFDLYDDENKENVALESDSDDDSYTENMNEKKDVFVNDHKVDFNKDKWRTASFISDCSTVVNTDESTVTITSDEVVHHVDELLLGALNDLTQLLKEGFDWELCARWLRAIRDRCPTAPERAAYWECRAVLEERRGDLPASVQCWEEAIAKGTEHSVVEACLDQLLDKFLQLRISPSGGSRRPLPDSKMVDVKNVFKSTVIRFAVLQAKLRQTNPGEVPQARFTVTPVRRSARLSVHSQAQTPLRICASVKHACAMGATEFRPNRTLCGTP